MKKIIFIFIIVSTFFLTACKKKERKINKEEPTDELALTIYSDNGKNDGAFLVKSFGHAFLALKNNTSSPINLYGYSLPSGDEITFGAWGIDDNYGIWFDLESQYYNNCGRYKGVVSVTSYIDISKLDIINDFIKNNDDWRLTKNCVYFAQNIWDLVVDKNEVINHVTRNQPSKLYKRIKEFDSYEVDRPMVKHDYAFTFIDGEIKYYYVEG